jgi:hypothetical protein
VPVSLGSLHGREGGMGKTESLKGLVIASASFGFFIGATKMETLSIFPHLAKH